MLAVKGFSMEKRLCWATLGIAGFVLLLFLLDAIMDIPFYGIEKWVDYLGIAASGLLGYLAWDTLRELK